MQEGESPVGPPGVRVAGPRVGTLFAERYRIEALLGEGGMGAVYRAYDERVGEVVALKTLVVRDDRDRSAARRFRREVRLARRVTHPNVARIHDLGEHAGIEFLTMEYVNGRDLQRILPAQGRLGPERAAALGHPMAEALGAIHATGVVHRDVKPANILMADDGRVVLTDFGIARGEGERGEGRTGAPLGTPLYMAPEQITGRPVDGRTDLYALGLVLYELSTGRLPFLEASPLATAFARLQRDAPDPRELIAMPDELAELILRCLSRDPDHRPASASEVAAALAPFARAGALSLGSATMAGVRPASLAITTPGSQPISPGDRTLAVLPFRYRGPATHDYLGDAVTDELIDLLSRTRGLRVLASGATQRYREERDPRTVGALLAADALVDGSVHVAGERVRVSARLCDVQNGTVLWNDRFEGSLGDVFAFQDRMGRRVAESLRVGLDTASHGQTAPQEAIEHYLRARHKMRAHTIDSSLVGPTGVIAQLERALELAPDLTPALAARAMASLRAWFTPGERTRDWEQTARESVSLALERGPDVAETQLAAATLAVQDGRYADAARHLDHALRIAPTCAPAHEYLGRLSCEAGKANLGLQHLRLALDLDPTLAFAWQDIARVEQLHGRAERAERAQCRLEEAVGPAHPASFSNRMRFACWRGDLDGIRKLLSVPAQVAATAHEFLVLYGRVVVGDVPLAEATERFDRHLEGVANPRYQSVVLQFACELSSAAGETDLALTYLERAARNLLIDVDWLSHCPVLELLRSETRFHEAHALVQQRALAMWAV